MKSITRFITQTLKLKVNEAKSAVARPQERKFLGFSFTAGPDVKRTIAPKSLDRFKQRIREITRRAMGVSIETTMEELIPYMRGCAAISASAKRLRCWLLSPDGSGCDSGLLYGASGKHHVAAGQHSSQTESRRGRQGKRPAVVGVLGVLPEAEPSPPGSQTRTSRRSVSPPVPIVLDAQLLEPPCTDPYARWCGRGGVARLPPIPIAGSDSPVRYGRVARQLHPHQRTFARQSNRGHSSQCCRRQVALGFIAR
jgi:hypothetical protein